MASIFERVCPQCATTNSVSAVQCGCGYRFDGSQSTSIDQAAQDEQLYLDYLTARIAQASEALDFARAAAAREPESHALAAEVIAGEQALRTARAEHAEQAARVRNARQQAMATRNVARPTPPITRPLVSAPAPKQVTVATPPKPAIAAPASKPVVAEPAPKPVIAAPTPAPSSNTLPRQTAATLAARAKALKPKHRALAAAARSKSARHPSPAPRPMAAASQPRTSAVPSAPFRAKQAARAEQVVERQRAAPAVVPTMSAPIASAPRTPAPQLKTSRPVATPGIRAAAAAPGVAMKSCPSCGNRIAASAARCTCGFEVSDGPELPGLSPVAAPAVMAKPEAPGKSCPHCGGKVTAAMGHCRCGYEFSDGPDIPGLPPMSEADQAFLFEFGVLKPT